MRAVAGGGLGTPSQGLRYALNHIVVTGQSTSVGGGGLPPISTSQPFQNKMLLDSTGVYDITKPLAGTLSLRPLVAYPTDRQATTTVAYPLNIYGESIDVRMANQLSAWLAPGGSPAFATTCAGEAGQPMSVIMKGGTGNAYAASLYEFQAIHALARAGYQSHGVDCVLLDHGQVDSQNLLYGAQVQALLGNYDADLRALYGQVGPLQMLVMQQNSYPLNTGSAFENLSGRQQLALCQANPTRFVGVGPSYQYVPFNDNVHFPASSHVLRAEMAAFVRLQMLNGGLWRGLWPTSITRSGNDVTIVMNVPLGGSLVLDTTTTTAPHLTGTFASWAAGFGFEAWIGGFAGTIVGINSITVGAQGVVVHCASQPDTISYAHVADVTGEGVTGGRRGNIRGGVAHPAGLSGIAQFDWLWEFSQGGL